MTAIVRRNWLLLMRKLGWREIYHLCKITQRGLGEKRSNQDLNTGLPTSIGFLAIVFYSIIGACKRNSEMSLILEF